MCWPDDNQSVQELYLADLRKNLILPKIQESSESKNLNPAQTPNSTIYCFTLKYLDEEIN